MYTEQNYHSFLPARVCQGEQHLITYLALTMTLVKKWTLRASAEEHGGAAT